MHNLNFSFENSGNLTEESRNYAIDEFIEEAREAGMTVTKIGDIVNIGHEDASTFVDFVKSLDTVEEE